MINDCFQVWAPRAKSVWLHAWGRKINLQPCADFHRSGCWHAAELPTGYSETDLGEYMLSIDDGPARPDPRSPWQPHGYDGPSRQVAHDEFPWTDHHFQAKPLGSAIIYEAHIGTFTKDGTFEAAIERLDHLVELGITHLELMPVAEFPGEFGWGYDGVGLFAPKHSYGGPSGLKRLVDACHQRGLAVVLDVVYNHLGPVGNYLSEFGPYFSSQHSTPWGAALNYDGPFSDGVRRFFCDNALLWLRDYHFDGLRLDAVHAIVDATSYPFLEQLAVEVEQLSAHLGRHLTLIAESDLNDPRLLRSREAGGFALGAQWADDFHHALHTVITGEREGYYRDYGSVEALATAFQHPFVYTGQSSSARDRRHGRPAHYLSGHRFITFTQNHDQIGNRACGERLGHLVGQQRAKQAAACLLFSPHIPQLFQGEEFNCQQPFLYFADWNGQPELAEAVRHGRQAEFAAFGWQADDLKDPSDRQTYNDSQIDWLALAEQESQSVLRWYQQLIQLRKSYPELTDGDFEAVTVELSEAEQWLCVQRGRLRLCCNFSDHEQQLPLGDHAVGNWQIVLRSDDRELKDDAPSLSNSTGSINVPGRCAMILRINGQR